MPEVNFSGHCWEPASPQLPNLYRCPNIEEGIKACQQMEKKVLISLGGATGKNDLTDEKAKVLAKNLWDLFLGGKERSDIRPFGRWNNITSNRESWSIVSHKGWGGGGSLVGGFWLCNWKTHQGPPHQGPSLCPSLPPHLLLAVNWQSIFFSPPL